MNNYMSNPAAGLIEDTLEYLDISHAQAARDMGIPRSQLSDMFAGRKGVSVDTALRFERYTKSPADLLIRAQAEYDLRRAQKEKLSEIKRTVRPASVTLKAA
jgi:addiction module HigA family antidote